MQNKFTSVLAAGIAAIYLLSSCTGTSSTTFSTKEDSIRFAQSVMEKYPGEQLSASTDTVSPAKGRNLRNAQGLTPISWATVVEYESAYDKDPQLKAPEGYYYQGFMIDPSGYDQLLKTPSIKGLYLRLGKKPDGSYTVMLLGLNKDGKIIHSSDSTNLDPGNDETNFDQVPACPQVCP